MKFRKKPVVVEAIQFNGNNFEEIQNWVIDHALLKFAAYPLVERSKSNLSFIYIHTLEGTMTASPGDYIIRGIKGEFYPCKPDIFDQTYEGV